MYGMVNEALKVFLIDEFGSGVWEDVRRLAGVDEEVFLSMKGYPDSVTYGLAGAAAEATGIELGELLRRFGRSWVSFVRVRGYEDLLQVSGETVFELLGNLDTLHSRLATSFPELHPPSFRLEAPSETTEPHLLHYYSERPGLAPFVLGLVEGVGDLFGSEVCVELVEPRDGEGGHDVFAVQLIGKALADA
jgi:guanylate cyclase soluble subunit beta